MNPDQNNLTNQTNPNNEVQLPSETPMSLSIPENSEPKVSEPKPIEATTSIQPEIKIIPESPIETPITTPQTETPVVEVKSTQPPSNLTFDSTPDYSLTSKANDSKASTQTLVLIIAGILGVLVVFGGGYYFLISNKNQNSESKIAQNQSQPEVKETPKTESTPVVANKVLTLNEYQVAISKIEAKTVNTIKNTPINPSNNTLSLDQIRFASDDLFANYQELLGLNVPENAKPLHTILVTNYKSLVNSYDVILKSIKETNKISLEAKNQFSANYNKSVVGINDTLIKIKSLK